MLRILSFALVIIFAGSSFAGDLGCRNVYYSAVENMKPDMLKAQKVLDKKNRGGLVGGITGAVAAGTASIYLTRGWDNDPNDQDDNAYRAVNVVMGTVGGAWLGNAIGRHTSKSVKKARAQAEETINRYRGVLSAIELLNSADILLNHRTDASMDALAKANEFLHWYSIDEASAPRLLQGEASGEICQNGQVMTARELSTWVNSLP
jgi:hypothetical protein